MKKPIRLLALCFLAVVALVSCDSNENNDDLITQQVVYDNYCYVEDALGDVTASADLNILIQFNYTALTCNLAIQGLQLPDGTNFTTMTLEDMRLSVDQSTGWKTATAASVTANVSGQQPIAVKNVALRLLDRVIEVGTESSYQAPFSLEMSLGRYKLYVAPKTQYFIGKTTSVSDKGDQFSTTDGVYMLSVDPRKGEAALTLNGVRFINMMPDGITMKFSPIEVSMEGGVLNLNCKDLIPTSGDRPFAAFPISNLSGRVNPTSGMNLDFDCNATYSEGTVPYSIKAELAF